LLLASFWDSLPSVGVRVRQGEILIRVNCPETRAGM